MNIKKGTQLTLKIQSAGAQGMGVARTAEGQVVFVPFGIPGDLVEVTVVKSKKKFLEAQIDKILKPSPARIPPKCSHFGTCGGCKWQHMDYEAQLAHKKAEVTSNLKHLGGLQLPEPDQILGCSEIFGYRNKVEFSFSSMRWLSEAEVASTYALDRRALGFHIPGRWDKVLHIDYCHLHDAYSNEIRNFIFKYAVEHNLTFWNPREQRGLLRTLMLRISTTGQYLVLIQFGEDNQRDIHSLLSRLLEAFPKIFTLIYAVNIKGNDAIYDLDLHTFSGPGYIEEKLKAYNEGDPDLIFRVSPKSFYQTNSLQAERLYRRVLDYLQPVGNENIYDLYTGTGTIALYMARYVKSVTGIELVPDAITDAHINAELNGIRNVDFIVGDMKTAFSEDFISHYGHPDVVVVDPPRDGMHPAVASQLVRLKPQRIIYVSCNSATQARDIALMKDHYTIERYGPVDMFPHTHHIENVALLKATHSI
ncbi:tRNA (uracil-5-)-methyltransferase [Thermaurantimonas aggregans]|uniref:tRNA (Uracil-5-)-methyltransferase n=1 Tax=Thermaurantimonas aggregans TaxID=2173829 RepID=A0A401XM78_9FLAO|nr:23S rRNA (uracil(1939)-C(5))-methyltransferase RlmD [Thermaurantimonas aggregans]MCX8148000.1 23S rRNA (uracil(1939)-C(5))-methyltransferase RlmD [Thermaurantimonas aggregans]GCD78129.1 tRNA (uracil-5-)-methyltransferase [Thermaurantimonas aggregans]